MRLIACLDDARVLGAPKSEEICIKPRQTARAILRREDGLFAVMYSKKFDLYSLPGGGVEENEEPLDALLRELVEETGCSADEISEIGQVYEYRAHANYAQRNFYYFVKTKTRIPVPKLTENELKNETSCVWMNFDEVYKRISEPTHTTNQRKYLQARDVEALNFFVGNLSF